MHSKSDSIEFIINNEADEVIEELVDSLKNRYQNNLDSVCLQLYSFFVL